MEYEKSNKNETNLNILINNHLQTLRKDVKEINEMFKDFSIAFDFEILDFADNIA